jgi:LmbE family N-acetylglucosaminyl deacetylase
MSNALEPMINGAGTAEGLWAVWPARAGWPTLDIGAVGVPVVVAPHPDDEILGAGGLLAMVGRAEIVAVTDGEASHPDSRVYAPAELADIRRRETRTALHRLDPDAEWTVHRLGQPDGHIDEAALAARLRTLLTPGRWCLATWRGDGHPDHEAVGRAAARACRESGARLLEYPVWMWHWARPDDDRVPWHRAHRIELTAAARRAKASAVAAFVSQIEPLGPGPGDAPILPPGALARFDRHYETVLA